MKTLRAFACLVIGSLIAGPACLVIVLAQIAGEIAGRVMAVSTPLLDFALATLSHEEDHG